MRISVIAAGSRGDVQPFVALCVALNARGHRAELITHREFMPLAQAHGVTLLPLSIGSQAEFVNEESRRFLAGGGNPLAFLRWFVDVARRTALTSTLEMRDHARGADVIVGSGLVDPIGEAIAEHHKTRYVHAFLQPVLPSRDYPSAVHAVPPFPLPGAINRFEQHAMLQMFWLATRFLVQPCRRALGLGPASWRLPARIAVKRGDPFLLAFSPHVVPPSRDWPANIHVTGYWFLDAPADWQPPEALLRFLEAGPPPVYFGFGSMALKDARKTADLILAASEKVGCRAVLSAGWGCLGMRAGLPSHAFALDGLPHSWLFPRMAAAVHHGGAGTTAAALRAGIPQIITPFLTDQFFWGWQLSRLGVAPKSIRHGALDAPTLAARLSEVLRDAAMQKRAAALAGDIRAEDGSGEACRVIENAAELRG